MIKKNQRRLSQITSLMMLTLAGNTYASVLNPGFENGTTNWSLTGSAVLNNTHYSGEKGMRLGQSSND